MCQFKPVRRPERTFSTIPLNHSNPTAPQHENRLSTASSEAFKKVHQAVDLRSSWASSSGEEAAISELRPRSTVPLPTLPTPPPSPEKAYLPTDIRQDRNYLSNTEPSAAVIAAQKEEIAQLQSQINELRLLVSQLVAVIGNSKPADEVKAMLASATDKSASCISEALNDHHTRAVVAEVDDVHPRTSVQVAEEVMLAADKSVVDEAESSLLNDESVSIRVAERSTERMDEGSDAVADVTVGHLHLQPFHSEEPSITPRVSSESIHKFDSSISFIEPPSAIATRMNHRRPVLQQAKPLGQRLPIRRLSLERRKGGNAALI